MLHLDADSAGLAGEFGPYVEIEDRPGVFVSRRDASGFNYKIPELEIHFFTNRLPEHYGVSWTYQDVCISSFFIWK